MAEERRTGRSSEQFATVNRLADEQFDFCGCSVRLLLLFLIEIQFPTIPSQCIYRPIPTPKPKFTTGELAVASHPKYKLARRIGMYHLQENTKIIPKER